MKTVFKRKNTSNTIIAFACSCYCNCGCSCGCSTDYDGYTDGKYKSDNISGSSRFDSGNNEISRI